MRAITVLLCLPAALAVGQNRQKDQKDDAPRVLTASPFGVEPGKKAKVVLRGRKLAEAKDVRASAGSAKLARKGKVAVPDKQDASRVGDSEVEVEVEIPADAKGDAVELIVATPSGDAAAHKLLIDRTPVATEKEPNDGFKQAQSVAVGGVVEGVVSKPQDVDVYKFEAKAGDKVTVEVTAAQLGSPLDSFLVLYDESGEVVAMSDDIDKSRDSRVEATLKKAGAYYASVADANDLGGAAYRYRLAVRRR